MGVWREGWGSGIILLALGGMRVDYGLVEVAPRSWGRTLLVGTPGLEQDAPAISYSTTLLLETCVP